MKNRNIDMCEGPLFSKIVLYTIPIILTGVLQLLFNAADLVVVGRYCGSVSVAAVGATGALINLIVNLFIGLSVGTGVKTAQAIGAGDMDAIHKTVHTSIPAALIAGIFLTIVGVIGSEYFLVLMGTPEDVLPLSSVYMRLYFCGITFTMLYNFGAAILRAAGDTQGPLRYLTIAGVALATAISQAVSAILVLLALIKRTDACHLDLKQMHIDKTTLLGIMRIGIPSGLQSSLFSFSNVILQSSVNSLGSVVMSGSSAAGNIEGFTYVAMNAFHQAGLNFTGQNFGAKKYDRIGRIAFISLFCVTILGLILGISSYAFGEQLLSIYITDSAEAIHYGVNRLAIVAIPYFLCGLMDVMSGLIRGMGSAISPMIITLLGACGLRILWIYTVFPIPEYHTLECIFISYPLSWAITFIALLVLFLVLYKSHKKKLSSETVVSLSN